MTRVEWSELGGDEVEAVLSNLLYNTHGNSIRIRPSQGDFGIDVIVPTDTAPEMWDVYQIKKFARNLTKNQKDQIEGSFRRILVALTRRGIPLNNWYLVTPLDPTLENLMDWFDTMPTRILKSLIVDDKVNLTKSEQAQIRDWLGAPRRVVAWKGRDFCESLVSDYPYVVDYYLHGGRERLREGVAELAQLIGRDSSVRNQDAVALPEQGPAALLEPGDIREHLVRLDRVLDTDPHFRYGHSLDLICPILKAERGLVAATQEEIPGGRWMTFKIYQRSAQSLEERPIPIELDFNFAESPDDLDAFEVWRKYGKPFEATASLKADLPGGLPGELSNARVRIGPADGDRAPYRNRLRIVTPDGEVLNELGFTMRSTIGADGTGIWIHGSDDSGALATESLIDTVIGSTSNINFTLAPLAGREASKVVTAVAFTSNLEAPNILQVAGEYGDFHHFSAIDSNDPLTPSFVARMIQALSTIQTRTSNPVIIPDFSEMEPQERVAIRRAASLLEGHIVVGNWTDTIFEKKADSEFDPSGHYQIVMTEPLTAPVNGQTVTLGAVANMALSVSIEPIGNGEIKMVPRLNDILHSKMVSEIPLTSEGKRLVSGRRLPDPSAGDHSDDGQ